MWLFLLGTSIYLVPGAVAFAKAKQDLRTMGHLSRKTFLAAFVAHVGYAFIVLLACITSAWPLKLSGTFAIVVGVPLFVVGALVYLLARSQLRSFRQTWGLETKQLITTGIYRFSRNPQVVGSILFYLGAAVLARSGVAVCLVFVLVVGTLAWLPVEENYLERTFGLRYQQYRSTVPRWFGFSSRVE